ncbi:g3080 [Coccomyxa viridis]|uniref:Large ribosomal subunit protein uL29m n=1 Tax=Coccomyxa viridis TaxID=1274662 RepID=A0ABP1FLY2_9CHLO
MSIVRTLRAALGPHLLTPLRAFTTSARAQGLEEFIAEPVKEGEKVTAGRSWSAEDLRRKSWDDLHKLWYVLLKERNLLLSERDRYKAAGQVMPNGRRMTKVRKSMCRIKYVLYERARIEEDPSKSTVLKQFVRGL